MFGKLICFDIGDSLLKAVYFSGNSIKKTVAVKIPEGLISKGEISSVQAMADFIKLVAKEHNIPKGDAALVLPASLVVTRNVTVSAMTAKQLNYNLPFEFKGYLSQDKESYFYDYAVIDKITDENDKVTELKLFACAVLKATIDRYRTVLRKAGFNLKLALPDEWAISPLVRNYFRRLGDSVKDIALVEIGRSNTRIRILSEGFPSTKRTTNIGTEHIEKELSEFKGIGLEEAMGLVATHDASLLSTAEGMEIYNRLAIEVMRVINFYNYNNRERAIDCICLSGGGAAIAPVREAIIRSTGLALIDIHELADQLKNNDNVWLFLNATSCAYQGKEGK